MKKNKTKINGIVNRTESQLQSKIQEAKQIQEKIVSNLKLEDEINQEILATICVETYNITNELITFDPAKEAKFGKKKINFLTDKLLKSLYSQLWYKLKELIERKLGTEKKTDVDKLVSTIHKIIPYLLAARLAEHCDINLKKKKEHTSLDIAEGGKYKVGSLVPENSKTFANVKLRLEQTETITVSLTVDKAISSISLIIRTASTISEALQGIIDLYENLERIIETRKTLKKNFFEAFAKLQISDDNTGNRLIVMNEFKLKKILFFDINRATIFKTADIEKKIKHLVWDEDKGRYSQTKMTEYIKTNKDLKNKDIENLISSIESIVNHIVTKAKKGSPPVEPLYSSGTVLKEGQLIPLHEPLSSANSSISSLDNNSNSHYTAFNTFLIPPSAAPQNGDASLFDPFKQSSEPTTTYGRNSKTFPSSSMTKPINQKFDQKNATANPFYSSLEPSYTYSTNPHAFTSSSGPKPRNQESETRQATDLENFRDDQRRMNLEKLM